MRAKKPARTNTVGRLSKDGTLNRVRPFGETRRLRISEGLYGQPFVVLSSHVVPFGWLARVLMARPDQCHVTELNGTGIEVHVLGVDTSE